MTVAEKLFIIAYMFCTANLAGYGLRQQPMVSPLVVQAETVTVAPAAPTATPVPTATPTPAKTWHGLASYYSKAGCLGCDPMFRTASGEILDDQKHTMAMPPEVVRKYQLMGKTLSVTNPKTKITIGVKVNDTGGFSKYGRIADLSLAAKNSLMCSDLCQVIIDYGI